MGHFLWSSRPPTQLPAFCVCFADLESHLEAACVDVLTRLFNICFSPYLAKTETSARVCEESRLQNPTNGSPPQSIWHTTKWGIPPLPPDSSEVTPNVYAAHRDFWLFDSFKYMWPKLLGSYFCRWVIAWNPVSGPCACGVRARTVELFGILTTVPCWQLL